MASSSEMLHYKDLTPAPRLDNKTLNKMVWRSCQLQLASTMSACSL